MTKKSGKIKNTIQVGKNAKSTIEPSDDYKKKTAVFDFSFIGVFQAVEIREFNNFTKDATDYIKQLRVMMKNVSKLSQKTLNELVVGGSYRHCHKIDDDNDALARDIIRTLFNANSLSNYDQELGDEGLYQLGLQDGVRFIGTINGNIFRVYFVDYFHSLYPDERRNERNLRNYNFCPMTGNLS